MCQQCRITAKPISKTYVDRPEASTVAGGHIGVEGLDGGNAGSLAVLLVHVVGAGARVVTDPDTEVLDLEGVLLGDLKTMSCYPSPFPNSPTYHVDADDLTGGLLDLGKATQEVPETGLGDNLVRGEDAHAVERRSRVGLRGQMAPDNLVLLKTTWRKSQLRSSLHTSNIMSKVVVTPQLCRPSIASIVHNAVCWYADAIRQCPLPSPSTSQNLGVAVDHRNQLFVAAQWQLSSRNSSCAWCTIGMASMIASGCRHDSEKEKSAYPS